MSLLGVGKMTDKEIDFYDLSHYLEEYIEFYGLNHSEKLLVSNFCDFVFRREKGMLKLGDEVEI